jgi:hypothetical protein
MTHYKTVRFYSPLALLALAACGGSNGGSGGGAARVFDINGNLIKGPLKGAIAFIDANGNNLPDAGETQIETDEFGFYTLSSGSATSRVVAVTGPGTVDMSSGAVVAEMTLSAPAGATVITPLTTLIDGSSDLSVEELQASLGLTVNPLEFNPFAEGVDADQAVAAEKAAQQIATVLTTVTAMGGGDATAFAETVKAIAAKFDNQTTVVDMTASAFVGDVLDTAVAGVNAASSGADIVISAANRTILTDSVVNVNKILEDTLVSGVNLSSQAIKNALATASQFSESVAAIDVADLAAGNVTTGGFNDLETVKAALANTAPTDISLNANIIKAGQATVATATATDDESDPITFSIANNAAGEDGSFFTIHKDTGVITVDTTVSGYADKDSFSVVVKATDYTEKGGNTTFDAVDVKGKSYVETFELFKQDTGAFGLGSSFTLNDWDNSDSNALVADNTSLVGSVTNGVLKVGSDPVKLNLKNIDAFANSTGGKAPSISLTLDTVPLTTQTETANINIQILDGANSTADTGERIISLDMKINYSGDGTDATLTIPDQTATGFFTSSSGAKTNLEIVNGTSDLLVLSGGTVGSPTSLDLKVANLVTLAKEYASVDLLTAGEYNVLVTVTDGLKIQAGDGSGAITGIEMGLSIVDESEIFQISSNDITVTNLAGSGVAETVTTESSGGVLAATTAIEIEESAAKSAYSGGTALPTLSFSLGKLADSDATAKLKLSILDGNNGTVDTGERMISLDLDMAWDASASSFTLAPGDISGKAITSSGLESDISLSNSVADVLSISSGANSVAGSSLTVKMSSLIDAADDAISMDLLSKGNYTLQVEVVSGIKLYDVSGEAIDKVTAVVAVVDDAPLDISLATSGSAATINVDENDASGSISLTSVFGSTTISSGVAYSIVDNDSDATNNAFKIVGTNLVVDKVAQLDHETASTIDVKIKADTSDRTGTETFTVNINDVNDDPIAPTNLAFSIGAGAVQGGATGYTFAATDEDIPADSLTYSMAANEFFAMDSAGVITAKKALVNNDAGAQSLEVTFSDGTVSKTATVVGTITTNVAPTVTNTTFTASLSEDATVGASVFTITGDDSDGDNTALTYGISGNSKFVVDASTGAVTLAAATLDHETDATETFSIFSIDEKNTQSIAKTVTVTVGDANDAPVFTSGTTGISLNETALVGATAYTSAVTDPDGDSMTYALSGADASSFAVSTSGVVTLNAALNYEDKATYEFTLTASDGNGGSTAVNVDGAVTDRTENPFTVKASKITTDMSGDGIYGDVGDILVTVETAFSSFDTKFSDYEASEKVELNFSTDLFTLEDKLVTQADSTSGTAKYDSGLKSVQSAAPSGAYDIGITKVGMISGTSTKELVFFVVDSSAVTQSSFDLTVAGTYDVIDFGTDATNGTGDDVEVSQALDPFIFTVDIA